MTYYLFDAFGRFSGTASTASGNSTPLPPPALSPDYNWSGNAWVFAPDVRLVPPIEDLAGLRAQKNDEINAARLAANFSTFDYQGKTFTCDTLSRSDIDGINGYVAVYGSLPAGWPGAWKAADNSFLPIATVADWKTFYAAMIARGNANFAHAQALKTALAAAATASDIAVIRW